MNWKLILFGALAFFATIQVTSMVTGIVIHDGVLVADYEATHGHWRPELEQDPPDMMALMPMWMAFSFITSLVFAAIYGCVRSALSGSGVKKGLQFGLIGASFFACTCLGMFGVMNIPGTIWVWWAIEGFILWSLGGVALGAVAQKVAPE